LKYTLTFNLSKRNLKIKKEQNNKKQKGKQMKKRDILRLQKAIIELEGRINSVKFGYWLVKTKMIIKDEVEMLQKLSTPREEFVIYEQDRIKTAQRLADRNEDGTIKINNNNFVITQNLSLFQEEMESLRTKHAEVIKNRQQDIDDFNNIIEENSSIDILEKVHIDDIPVEIEPIFIESFMIVDVIKEN